MTTTDIPQLASENREKLGSRYAIRLRETGRLPGVVYGHGQDPVHIHIDAKELDELIHHSAQLVEVQLDGKAEPCLIKDVQYDYLDSTPVHVDFARVNLDEEVEVEVELSLTGEPVGLKTEGAVLDQQLFALEVRCKANNIPEIIEHDVSAMEAGDAISVEDITLPQGVEAVSDAETTVAIISVQEEVEIDTDSDDDAAEPEVIGHTDHDEEQGGSDGDEA
jgi:large subunit ribosomal protein L25